MRAFHATVYRAFTNSYTLQMSFDHNCQFQSNQCNIQEFSATRIQLKSYKEIELNFTAIQFITLSAINKDKISWIESLPPVGLENEDVLEKQKNNSFLSNLSLSLPLHVKYYWKERKIGTESNIKGVSNKAETCWLEGQSVTNCNSFSLQLWSRPWGKT